MAVGVIGLALIIWFLLRRRRYRKAKSAREEPTQSQPQHMTGICVACHQSGIKLGDYIEMPTYEHHVREMQGRGPFQTAQQEAQEIPAYYRPHELSGSYPRDRNDGQDSTG